MGKKLAALLADPRREAMFRAIEEDENHPLHTMLQQLRSAFGDLDEAMQDYKGIPGAVRDAPAQRGLKNERIVEKIVGHYKPGHAILNAARHLPYNSHDFVGSGAMFGLLKATQIMQDHSEATYQPVKQYLADLHKTVDLISEQIQTKDWPIVWS